MHNYDWNGWEDWIPLQSLDNNLALVPASPGAYIVATDRPVNRAIGTDLDGFLHIGESKTFGIVSGVSSNVLKTEVQRGTEPGGGSPSSVLNVSFRSPLFV